MPPMSPQIQQAEKRIMTSPDFFLAHSIPHMPQRRNGDESPSCGVCSRRARLKLTAPTATLDTPSPISSTESTKRLPMIWPLVHILLGSSFLPAQRWKLIIYLLSSKVLFSPFRPLPQSSSSNFSFFTSKTLSKGSGFPEPENHFRGGAREDRADPARGAFTQGPRAMGGSPEARTDEDLGILWRANPGPEPCQCRRRSPEFCRVSALRFQEPSAPLWLPSPSWRRNRAWFPSDKGEQLTTPLRPSSRLPSFVFLPAQSASVNP